MQTSFYILLLVEFSSQLTEPFVGTFDLFGWLKFACGDISLSPLGETFGDLLDTTDWVVFVVSWAKSSFTVKEGKFIFFTSFSVSWCWTTMWELVFIIESAKFESSFESLDVSVEFFPPMGSSLFAQVSVAPFSSELVQFVQTLERVSWWDLLVLSRCNSNDGSDGEFHFVYPC